MRDDKRGIGRAVAMKIVSMAAILMAFAAMVCTTGVFSITADAATTSGYCGADTYSVRWEIDDVGTLIISGSGAIKDYTARSGAPWYGMTVNALVIENGITRIGNYAFYENDLSRISIPNSVQSIGDYAFYGSHDLYSIKFSTSLTEIGEYAFSHCGDSYLPIDVILPSSVTTIGAYAFSYSYMDEVSVKGATAIGNYAFACSNTLTTVDLGTEATTIGTGAFSTCHALKEVIIPGTVDRIGQSAFKECWALSKVKIANGVTAIGAYAFENCSSLQSIVVPNSVTSISAGAFRYCSGLISISLPFVGTQPTRNTSPGVPNNVFGAIFGYQSSSYEDLTHQYYDDDHSSGWQYYWIPQSLRYVYITDGQYIPYGAFSGCNMLTIIKIPDSITAIGDYAFYGCTWLDSISLPDQVGSIGNLAFAYSDLAQFTVPSGTYSIGADAFAGCSNLADAYVTDPNAWCNINFENSASNPANFATRMHLWDSESQTELTELRLSDSVTAIPTAGFRNFSSLTSVVIPDSVQKIGLGAFAGCTKLESITLPFVGGSRKTADSLPQYPLGYIFGKTAYTGGVATLQLYHLDSTTDISSATYYIPASLKHITVTDGDILYGAFYNCENLVSVTLSDSVSCVEAAAFYSCTSLTAVFCEGAEDDITVSSSVGATPAWHYGVQEAVFADQNCYHCTACDGYFLPDGSHATATVIFKNWDGTVISTASYRYGDTVAQPDTPQKSADKTYTYRFDGWDKTVTACNGNATYTAVYTPVYIEYRVIFRDWNDAVLSDSTYHYGDAVVTPTDPTRAADNTYTYAFKGWDKTIGNCDGNATYTATYTPTYIEYRVIFRDWNGDLLSEGTYHYGDALVTPAVPTRAHAQPHIYYYAFSGWDETADTCIGNTTYTAVHAETYVDYTVTFENWDGTLLSQKTYHWGETVTPPTDPTRATDNVYSYTFAAWDETVADCAGDATYTATYTPTYVDYTVIFKNEDGTVLSQETYHWGEAIVAPDTPQKAADNVYTYTFNDWGKTVGNCAGDATYTATYTPVYVDYTVVFQRDDGTVISTKTYHWNDRISYPDNTDKPSDHIYNYDFEGWDKTDTRCSGDMVFTAIYDTSYVYYTVTFKRWDGEVIRTDYWCYWGETITEPSKPRLTYDDEYVYTFAGWDKEIVPCAGDTVYTALCNREKIAVKSISVYTGNCKTTYAEGEQFVADGLRVTAHYNNATSAIVTDYTLSGYDPSIGKKTITVSYEGCTTTFTVTVEAKRLWYISVTTDPTKKEYLEGDAFDPSGMVVTAYYHNCPEEIVTDYTLSGYDPSAGYKRLTVTYLDKTTTLSVHVQPKTVISLEITTLPDKRIYIEGEYIDPTGMVVTAYYDNNTSAVVTDYSFAYYSKAVGINEVTVRYYERASVTATLTVEHIKKSITRIEVTTLPSNLTCVEGLWYYPYDMTVTAYYNNNTSEPVWDYSFLSDTDTPGLCDVIVEYEGFTTSFQIEVVAKSVVGIDIEYYPDKCTYFVGEAFDPTGMVVRLIYDNGTSEETADYTVSGYSPTEGIHTVTVAYGDFAADFMVEVLPCPVGWYEADGLWYYYENGVKLTNTWRKDSVGWVYLGEDGAMVTNAWVSDSVGPCYVGFDGYMVTNDWVMSENGECYIGANGYIATNCWLQMYDGWVWLNKNGTITYSQWILDGGKWYYLDADGYMVTNQWRKDSKGWCYLLANGAMATNRWIKDSKGWCYVGASGYCVTNCWMKDSVGWVYLDAEGSMVYNRWIADSKGWCYVGANGYMTTNAWVKDSNGWCYIGADGYCLKNTSKKIGGKTYHFNSNGTCTNP